MDMMRAESLAKKLISEHAPDYRFQWHDRINHLGTCNYRHKTIKLSMSWTKKLPESQVLDTILHEIAHALAEKEGHRGHGPIWQRHAKLLGANPSGTAHTGLNVEDIKEPKYKMVFREETVKVYYSKPTKDTYESAKFMWVRGRKDETRGKLKIVTYKVNPLKALYDKGITFTGLSKKCLHCNKKDTNWTITSNYKWLHKCGQETAE